MFDQCTNMPLFVMSRELITAELTAVKAVYIITALGQVEIQLLVLVQMSITLITIFLSYT